jgi:hypothetical protein
MSRIANVEQGCLVLADISGYSAYLAGVELEHSADIVADLLGVVGAQITGPFRIAKVEGDALFAYALEGVEADAVVATLEAAYAAFASRTRTIEVTSSCPCRACKGVGELDLKLILHWGEFARHEVTGSQELRIGRRAGPSPAQELRQHNGGTARLRVVDRSRRGRARPGSGVDRHGAP